MVKSLDYGSFVPYFKGDRIFLARSKGKAWHWHEGCSSPTSCGFVKDKSCQTNLIFLWQGSRSVRGEELLLWYSLTAVRLLTLTHGVFQERGGGIWMGRNAVRYQTSWANTLKTVCCLLSEWKDGMNTVLEGSVQPLALLNIFISDLGSGIWRRLIASVDNTKLRGAVSALREEEKDSGILTN